MLPKRRPAVNPGTDHRFAMDTPQHRRTLPGTSLSNLDTLPPLPLPCLGGALLVACWWLVGPMWIVQTPAITQLADPRHKPRFVSLL